MKIPSTLAAAVLIAACAHPNYAPTWPHRLASGGPQPGYAIKQVVEKQRPATLMADDGSVCRTSRERFAGTKKGAWIACDWTPPAPDSTASAPNRTRTG